MPSTRESPDLRQPLRCYRSAGLTVRSAIELPEWEIFLGNNGTDASDVDISLAPAAPIEEGSDVFSAAECRFCVPQIAQYSIVQGTHIEVTPAPQSGLAELRLFLLGSAWATLLYQRGLLCLHASAVDLPGGAVAFCGESGAGKSSLCAALVRAGAGFIADDLCRVETHARAARIYPSSSRMKLWDDAVCQMDASMQILQRDHFRYDKFHVQTAALLQPHPRPLRAIFLLEWGELGIEDLRGKAALSRLVRTATYRPGLLSRMEAVARHWQNLLELVGAVRVFVLRRPRSWTSMDAALTTINRKLQELS